MRALGRLALRRPSRLFPSLGAARAAAAASQKPPQQGIEGVFSFRGCIGLKTSRVEGVKGFRGLYGV